MLGSVRVFRDGSGDEGTYYILFKSDGCLSQRYARK
jgi:hypothetical protein